MAINKTPLLPGQSPAFAAGAGLPFNAKAASTASTLSSNYSNPFESILMVFAVLLLVNHLGRPFEHILIGMRIPAVLCVLGAIVTVASCLSAFKTTPGKMLALWLIWMVLILPLSYWRGGSLSYVAYFVAFWVVLYMIIACAPKSFGQLKLLYLVIAIAAPANILIAGRFDNQIRFDMEGTFGNADDAAILAGFAIPFWLFLTSRWPMFLRVLFALSGTIFLLRVIIMTATRSMLISLFCMFLIWFWRTSVLYKISGIMITAVASIALITTAPQSVRDRLATTFEAFTTDRLRAADDEASGSAIMRRELLMDGLKTTLKYPIWGVGPGQFTSYRWSALSTSDSPKAGIKTHNTYVQVAVESGIPALLFYLAWVWTTYRAIARVRKAAASKATPGLELGFEMASYLELALVFFAVTALFMTMETHPYMFIMAGAAVAVERLTQAELGRFKDAQRTVPSRISLAPSTAGLR